MEEEQNVSLLSCKKQGESNREPFGCWNEEPGLNMRVQAVASIAGIVLIHFTWPSAKATLTPSLEIARAVSLRKALYLLPARKEPK